MKNKYLYILGTLLVAGAMTACSPDEFAGMSENGVPMASAYAEQIIVDVNQETNEVTFTLNAKGVYPVWTIVTGYEKNGDEKIEIKTVNGYSRIFKKEGDYLVRAQIANRDGVSDGVIEKAFHIDHSLSNTPAFLGFDYDSPDNLWKQAKAEFASLYYAHGESWEGYPDYTHSEVDDTYSLILPSESNNQWQAQYALTTSLDNSIVPADATYDFSVIISSNNDIKGITLKLTQDGDDSNYMFENRADLVGGEDNVIYFTEMSGKDLAGSKYKFVFDFGGNPDNTEIEIRNIVLIDHTKNKITPPAAEEENPIIWRDADNLWNKSAVEITTYNAQGDDWHAPAVPLSYTEHTDGSYTVVLPSESNSQWQAQFALHGGCSTSADKHYDLKVVLTPNVELQGVTVKWVLDGGGENDKVFYSEARHNLVADEDNAIILADAEGIDMDKLALVLDFGGNPANTEVIVSGIHVQEHKEFAWNEDKNLWNNSAVNITTYNAQGDDWHAPAVQMSYDANADGSYTVKLPSESNSQWQAQFALHGGCSTSASKNYDLRVILTPNVDLKGVTVKWVLDGGGENDKVFYTEARHDIVADEDNVISLINAPGIDMDKLTLFLDFGGNPANTEVIVSGILVQESE